MEEHTSNTSEENSQPIDSNNPTSPLRSRKENKKSDDEGSAFDCNICLDAATEPVVTMCGHLFCWPCIYEWIKLRGERPCPVCKSAVQQDKLIPLYGRGNGNQTDPRTKIPERPSGQRTEPAPQPGFGFPFTTQFGPNAHFDGMAFSAGFGFFPSLFGLQFGNLPVQPGRPLTAQESQHQFISRITLAFGIMMILFLLMDS